MEEPTLDSLMGTEQNPSELAAFQDVPSVGLKLPSATIRNRASVTSFIAGQPDQAVENYQMMVAEGEQGQDALTKNLQQQGTSRAKAGDMKTMMGLLSDPNIPFDQKKSLVNTYNQTKVDPATVLMTNNLSQGSVGETHEAEQSRLKVADLIQQVEDARSLEQGLVNSYISSRSGKNFTSVADTAATWFAPFGTNITAGKVTAKALPEGSSAWDYIKSFALPGSAITDLKEKMKNTPAPERIAMTKSLLENISQNSGLIASSENQINQMQMANDIVNGEYTTFDKWLDNFSGLLDVVGMGALIKTPKRAMAAEKAVQATQDAATAAKAPVGGFEATVRPRSAEEFKGFVAGQQDRMISKLESEKTDLLGAAGNRLDNGQVKSLSQELAAIQAKVMPSSPADIKAAAKEIQTNQKVGYKEASSIAAKQIQEYNDELKASSLRIEQQIESNRQASSSAQRIAAIEKEIEQLKANRVDAPGALTPIADLTRRIEMRGISGMVNPSSTAAIIQQTNPEKARTVLQAVFNGEDSVAQGLYGTNKLEAITADVVPQMVTESGRVTSKPVDLQRNLRTDMNVPEEVMNAAFSSGALEYTKAEKAAARANKVNDFSAAEGLEINPPMSSFRLEGNQHHISAVYGTPEGSFLNAQQAYDQALYALRKQGVLPEEITILSKEGLDHVPVKLEDVKGVEGNYLVRVDMRQELSPKDIDKWETVDVMRNFLDRFSTLISNNKGSAARNVMDAASMLHPVYSGAATVSKDLAAKFEKTMLELASQFSDKYVKLPKAEQARVDSYIREANSKRIPLSQGDLMARGMSADEMATVGAWRSFWDGHFYLENLDLIRTLNAQGYQKLVAPNADLFAKPMKAQANVGKVYDPTHDTVLTLADQAVKDLYANGGYFAKLRRPTQFGADTAEYVVVRNDPNEYLRSLRDTDRALNYIDGYYQVSYKAPRFVDEMSPDGMRRAVAVAGDTAEAQHFADRMKAQNPDMVYNVRADDRAMRTSSDDWFDIHSASGRIAQRHRGKLLEDASGLNLLGDGSYVVNPVESAIHSAKSVAGRTMMRPALEAMKARFLDNRKAFLPSDGMGGVRFPTRYEEIGIKGGTVTSTVADARTEYEYIRYLENGYINSLDDTFKMGFHVLADIAGGAGLSKVERAALNAADISLSGTAKGAVFGATIAANPIRQWIVQTHQVVRTFSYNPQGWLSGNIPKLMGEYTGSKVMPGTQFSKEGQEFIKFLDGTGLMEAVDKQNLVRGTLLAAADNSNKLLKAAGTVPNAMRRIGFDVGEMGNTLGHGAAVFDRYKRLGKDMTDATTLAEAHSEVRAITGEMNFAGDMPYNQTSASMVLQFMQVPHKMALQATNRRIDPAIRARMIAADAVMWGAPTALVSDLLGGDILPDDPKLKEFFVNGLESLIFNESLRQMYKDNSINIDFSSLSPVDYHGWAQFFHTLKTSPLDTIVNSPAGSLFLKDGGRIQTAIGSLGRFFGIVKDEYKDPQEAISVLNDVMSISSGWSNAVKAHLALETGKIYDKYGNVIDSHAHPIEAYMLGLGFGSATQRDMFTASQAASQTSKEFKDEVTKVMDDVAKYYQRELSRGNTDIEYMTKVSGFVLKKYENNPQAQEIAAQWMTSHLFQDKESQLVYMMMKAAGLPEGDKLKDTIRTMPVSDDQKQMMMQRIDDVEALRNKGK